LFFIEGNSRCLWDEEGIEEFTTELRGGDTEFHGEERVAI